MARSRWLMVFLAAGLVACSEPFLTIPGGQLSGVETEHPENWAFTDPISTIQVETAPEDPYSINIWAVALDGNLYLHAGRNRTTWVENLEADPRTRVRVEGKLYELAATRVETADEFARFADAYEAKYDTRPRNENVEEAYVFRLTPR
ncbi:MAG: nitroreductase family deazaflavin-dependent oxidoreductase [Proteobacteria bacterium]|nr:nitroreductase family deazaflavin-dependent oxidoreductase [Pseudomonadota bacterium]